MRIINWLKSVLIDPISVLIDESKRINEDGSWDGYNRKNNEKERGGHV